ncbi:hypothetical protein JST56_03895 [Candidatus Dependentiae bacterium]|jgi:hypothetical protein|nr:hypothetical protein [Candidatus Dependentiae bacterium]
MLLKKIISIVLTCLMTQNPLPALVDSICAKTTNHETTEPVNCSFYVKSPMTSSHAKSLLITGLLLELGVFSALIAAQKNQTIETFMQENDWVDVVLGLSCLTGMGLTLAGGISLGIDYAPPVLKLTKQGIATQLKSTPWNAIERVAEKKDQPFYCSSEKSFIQVLLHDGNVIKLYCNNNIVSDNDRSNTISATQLAKIINEFFDAHKQSNHDAS